MYQIVTIVSIVLFLSFANTGIAQNSTENRCDIPREITFDRPDPQGIPTVVDIQLYVIDVNQIKDANQTFLTDFIVTYQWNDPRLSAASLGKSLKYCRIDINSVWNPALNLVNMSWPVTRFYDDIVTVDDEGNVQFYQRTLGFLESPLNIEKFPFDRQTLPITFATINYSSEELTLNVDSKDTDIRGKLSIVGWDIKPEISYENKTESVPDLGNVPLVDFKINAKRQSSYFVWLFMLSLSLIVFMAWCVFWIDPSQLGPQIGISTASVFTLIAFRFAISNQLPKVSFLTVMDKFVLFSTILIFLALGESILVSRISRDGNEALARKIDSTARWVYLGLFALLLLYIYIISRA